jgi:Putative metal-binding motif
MKGSGIGGRGMRAIATTIAAVAALACAAPAMAAPSNDDVAGAFSVPLNTTWTQATTDATPATGSDSLGNCTFSNGSDPRFFGNSVWYRFTGTGAPVTLDTTGSTFDTVLLVWRGTPSPSGTPLYCDDDSGGVQGPARLTRTFEAGVEYYVELGGCVSTTKPGSCGARSGNLAFTLLANDARSNPEVLAPGAAVTRTNLGATTESEPLSCNGAGYNKTVWFRFAAPQAGTATFAATGFNAVVSFLPAGSNAVLGCNAGGIVGTVGAKLGMHVAAGTYDVQVGSRDSSAAQVTVSFDFTADPPAGAVDADHDGYSPPADCDDGNGSIHPGAKEVPNNDVDEDCDKVKSFDRDHDGYVAGVGAGFDCNDGNAKIHPKAHDIAGNGKDEDCSGRDATLHRLPGIIDVHGGTTGATTVLSSFFATRLAKGTTVTLRCSRHWCRKGTRVVHIKKARKRFDVLHLLRSRRLPPGVVLTLQVTRSEYLGQALRVTTRAGKPPRKSELCIRPGHKAVSC